MRANRGRRATSSPGSAPSAWPCLLEHAIEAASASALELLSKLAALFAGMGLVNMVYTHRLKQFQDHSEGDPSALLIPALLDKQVRAFHPRPQQPMCYQHYKTNVLL